MHKLHQAPDLVPLKTSDEMPANLLVGKSRVLTNGLLGAVFAEVPMAGFDRFADPLGGNFLRNRDQDDFGWVPPGTLSRRGERGSHPLERGGDFAQLPSPSSYGLGAALLWTRRLLLAQKARNVEVFLLFRLGIEDKVGLRTDFLLFLGRGHLSL